MRQHAPCVVPLKTVTRKLIYTKNNRDLAKMTVIFFAFFGFYHTSHKLNNCDDTPRTVFRNVEKSRICR